MAMPLLLLMMLTIAPPSLDYVTVFRCPICGISLLKNVSHVGMSLWWGGQSLPPGRPKCFASVWPLSSTATFGEWVINVNYASTTLEDPHLTQLAEKKRKEESSENGIGFNFCGKYLHKQMLVDVIAYGAACSNGILPNRIWIGHPKFFLTMGFPYTYKLYLNQKFGR